MNQKITHPTALLDLAQDSGLDQKRYMFVVESMGPIFVAVENGIAEAGTINVTGETQTGLIEKAGEVRGGLKELRLELEHVRVDLKSDSLKLGTFIDKCARMIRLRIEPAEEKMKAAAEFAERAAEARRKELAHKRAVLLEPFGTDLTFHNLGLMDEATFGRLLDAERREFVRKEEERKTKEEAEKAEREQREREAADLRAENERLHKERQADRDRETAAAEAARVERLRLQALADVERQKADTARRDAQKAQDAERGRQAVAAAEEARKKREAEEAQRKAEAAPDAEKLREFSKAVAALVIPTMSTRRGKVALEALKNGVGDLAVYVLELAEALEK